MLVYLIFVNLFGRVFELPIQNTNLESDTLIYYSLSVPFSGIRAGRWDIIGSTVVNNRLISLTADFKNRRGGLWNNLVGLRLLPLNYLFTIKNIIKIFKQVKEKYWEIHLHFRVHGKTKKNYGNGFAFWYTSQKTTLG